MDLTLSKDEITALTGYKRSNEQLAELKRQGYHRARLSPVTGRVILERAHYEAVAAGNYGASKGRSSEPPAELMPA